MPVLKNQRHELMAQALAKGATADAAYKAAGYKPDRHNAARLTTNDHIMTRVLELQQKTLDKVIQHASVNVREQMQKLIRIVDLALEAKDLKVAGENQRFIMELFGYLDHPTMAHEHLADTRAPLAPAPSEPQPQQGGNILTLGKGHLEVRKRIAANKAKRK